MSDKVYYIPYSKKKGQLIILYNDNYYTISEIIKNNLNLDIKYIIYNSDYDLNNINNGLDNGLDNVFDKLINLEHIELKNNNLEILPSLNSLIKLEYLNCHDNNLNIIPSLNSLSNLKTLIISKNNISILPSLNNLTKLEKLDCSVNNLKYIPLLNNLSNLKELIFHSNDISEFPNIDNLCNLEYLACSCNKIKELPNLNKFSKLKILQCSDNNISGTLNLDGLINLKELYFYNNKINKIINLEKLINLKELDCQNNLIDILPSHKNLVNLKSLICNNNKIKYINNLPCNLRYLFVNNNNIIEISDDLPDTIKELYLSDNKDLKYLPSSLINCKSLRLIYYYNTQIITNKLPSHIKNFIKLIKYYNCSFQSDHPRFNALSTGGLDGLVFYGMQDIYLENGNELLRYSNNFDNYNNNNKNKLYNIINENTNYFYKNKFIIKDIYTDKIFKYDEMTYNNFIYFIYNLNISEKDINKIKDYCTSNSSIHEGILLYTYEIIWHIIIYIYRKCNNNEYFICENNNKLNIVEEKINYIVSCCDSNNNIDDNIKNIMTVI